MSLFHLGMLSLISFISLSVSHVYNLEAKTADSLFHQSYEQMLAVRSDSQKTFPSALMFVNSFFQKGKCQLKQVFKLFCKVLYRGSQISDQTGSWKAKR